MAEEPRTVIVERSSRGSATAIIAIIALLIVAAVGYMLVDSRSDRDNAVSTAAEQVGEAAQDVGDAAERTTNPE